MDNPLEILDDIGLTMYTDIKGLSDSDTQEAINALLFDQTMRYYKNRMDIIIPKVPQKTSKWMINNFFKAVKMKVYDSFKEDYKADLMNDVDSMEYFGDFITTDVLDAAITEVPIETQLLKEETCGELKGINNRIVDELNEFMRLDTELGSTVQKRILKKELEDKIRAQEEILSFGRRL